MDKLTVLGIDCGIAITGWAIITSQKMKRQRSTLRVHDYGVIRTDANTEPAQRLVHLYDALIDLLDKKRIHEVAIESLYYFKNQKTIMSVGAARGVTLFAYARNSLPIFDYTPLQVKQAVTGYGKATKQQVQILVKNLLKLKDLPRPDDAADALAVAICHLNTRSW